MKKVYISDEAPAVDVLPMSHAVESNGLVYTSGQVHLSKDLQLLGGTTAEKTQQVMSNLEAILKTAGLSFADVIKTTIYVTDMSIYPDLNNVYSTYFDGDYPAREVVCVKELPAGASLEISMVAAR